MSFINYYEILEIQQTSDEAVIRKAFNKLAKKYHPDKNIGDKSAEIKMIKINDAIGILLNTISRKAHDEQLEEENAKRLRQSNAVKAYNEGSEATSREDFQAAIKHFTKAIELNPKYIIAYAHRGLAYKNLRKYDEAIADYSKAIELDPKYMPAYANRGYAYQNLNRHTEAIADYSKAIELEPKNPSIYYNRGLAFNDLNKHPEAIADHTKAIELDPKNAGAYANRGYAYQNLNRHTEAIADYSKAIELEPKNPSIYYNRGLAFNDLNKHPEAIADHTKAIELDPKFANAANNKAKKKAEKEVMSESNFLWPSGYDKLLAEAKAWDETETWKKAKAEEKAKAEAKDNARANAAKAEVLARQSRDKAAEAWAAECRSKEEADALATRENAEAEEQKTTWLHKLWKLMTATK